MPVQEDFLHYLWKFRMFDQSGMRSIAGEAIQILHAGFHNSHAGPDFENALIRIGDTLWAGNVEIHLRSSDWERHQHQKDKAYDNVILHVVGNHDQEIFRTDKTAIPVLSLEGRIPQKLVLAYRSLAECMDWIPCGKQISTIESFYIQNWLYRVAIERLELKSELVNKLLTEYKGGWDEAFYIGLATNFGFKVNAMPFEMLARSLPQHILARYKDKTLQIEALVFGQAGFLSQKHQDEYPQRLAKEYNFLQKKHSLTPLDNYVWKYLRMRPVNFPTIRLAQFAALIIKANHLFSKIISERNIPVIVRMFHDLPVNSYWARHYRFDIQTEHAAYRLGEQSINNLLINTVAVFLMAYGRRTGSPDHINRSIALLESLPAETNALVGRFKELNIKPDNAFFSQALIQLKKAYCDEKKCLSCGIGMKLVNM